jgi:putative redox protein
MRTVSIAWQPEAERFVALGGHAQHPVAINAPHEGPATGFSPAELLLAAAGSCAAWDVVEILRKQHQPLISLSVSVHGRQHEGPPHQFEDVELFFEAAGRGLDARKVERAVALSETRYCAVLATIRGVARVSCRVEVHEAAT